MAKRSVLTQIQEETTRFLCYRTYFSRTIRTFAVLLEEKTRKEMYKPLSETRKAQNQDDYEKKRK